MRVTADSPDGTRYTITAQPAPMRVGLTCSPDNYRSHAATFPDAAFCRVFAGPGAGLPTLGRAPWPEWVSFKDWPAEQTLIAWLDRIVRPTIITLEHEHDNGKTAAQQTAAFRAAHFARWRDLMAIIDAHPNRPLITAMPIQTLQWTVAASNPARGIFKGDGNWRTWWAGVGDGAAMDCYVDSWAGHYPDPAKWLRLPVEFAHGAGRRLWIPELGSALLGDDTGPGRAAWITDVVAVLREAGCAGVAWWCALGTPGGTGEIRDFHLTDQPSAHAWRAAIDGSGR